MKVFHTNAKVPLRLARQSRRMSAKQVARILKVGISTVCAWETGARNPKPENAKAYAKAIRFPVGRLLLPPIE